MATMHIVAAAERKPKFPLTAKQPYFLGYPHARGLCDIAPPWPDVQTAVPAPNRIRPCQAPRETHDD